jgi:DNA-binding transcriptional MerR regulator
VDVMTIGEFSARSRLSAKASRLYDRLGLLSPARVRRSGRQHRREQRASSRST